MTKENYANERVCRNKNKSRLTDSLPSSSSPRSLSSFVFIQFRRSVRAHCKVLQFHFAPCAFSLLPTQINGGFDTYSGSTRLSLASLPSSECFTRSNPFGEARERPTKEAGDEEEQKQKRKMNFMRMGIKMKALRMTKLSLAT
jgi:hypothetical protein